MTEPTKRVEINVSTNKFKGLTTYSVTVELTAEQPQALGDIALELETLKLSDELVAELVKRYPLEGFSNKASDA